MPVTLHVPIRRISQKEFAELSYEVMGHVFAIRNELGRFFDEKIYKRELTHRMSEVRLEEPIDLSFGPFQKRCFIDVLVAGAGLFEFKAVESLSGRHRSQILQYLMLCGFEHGKLINIRPEDVEHEFVNCGWQAEARRAFTVDEARWSIEMPGARPLYEFLIGLLRDLGTGLEIGLYEEAVEQCFGGGERGKAEVAVRLGGHKLGNQCMRMIAPGVALKITSLTRSLDAFEMHARKLLDHADLRAIAWVNIDLQKVTFTTIEE